jgi:hypothetical protein
LKLMPDNGTVQRRIGETMPETSVKAVTIAKQRFELDSGRVERAVRRALPEPIASHYVVIDRRRYPPKQAIGLVTGLDRADFTSHQARRILMGLGFAVGRRRPPSADLHDVELAGAERRVAGIQRSPATSAGPAARRRELAETLRSFRGQWVAIGDGELLVAAPTPKEVVGWLAQHGRQAESMFRVPEDELALGGLAPL